MAVLAALTGALVGYPIRRVSANPAFPISVISSESVGASSASVPPGGGGRGRTFYVAPTGSDSNPGTASAPWQTLLYAAQAVGQPGGPQAGDTVLVHGGTYNEQVVLSLGGNATDGPVTFANYPGELPVIDGSHEVTNWTLVAGTVWQANFTRAGLINTRIGPTDPAFESSCPDNYNQSGDRRGYVYVDDTPDAQHWLRPYCMGRDPSIDTPTALPADSWAATSPPAPQSTGFYASRTDTLYVNLADGSDPNTHRVRIPAYEHALLFWGDSPNYLTVRGLSLRLATGGVYNWSIANHITLDGLDVSLNKQWSIAADACSSEWQIVNSHLHDNEYEGIHLEADSSLVQGNLIERTLAPWSQYGADGINVLGSRNYVVGNTIHDMHKSVDSRAGVGISVEEWYNTGCWTETSQYNTLEKNRIYNNSGTGIYNSGGDNAVIKNNLVYTNGGHGINIESGGSGSAGASPTPAQQLTLGTIIANNTIYANANEGIANNPSGQGTIIVNNIVFANNNGSGPQIYLSKGATQTLTSNLVGVDPEFVDPTTGDFHLRPSSPGINRGSTDADVPDDFAGTPRLQRAAVDVGAFER